MTHYILKKNGITKSTVFCHLYGNNIFIPENEARRSDYDGCKFESLDELIIDSEDSMSDIRTFFSLNCPYYTFEVWVNNEMIESHNFYTRNEFLQIVFPKLSGIESCFKE
jgi:hypothetical protein